MRKGNDCSISGSKLQFLVGGVVYLRCGVPDTKSLLASVLKEEAITEYSIVVTDVETNTSASDVIASPKLTLSVAGQLHLGDELKSTGSPWPYPPNVVQLLRSFKL